MKRINQLIIEGTVDIVNNDDIFWLWYDDNTGFVVHKLKQFKNILKDKQKVRIVGKLKNYGDIDETVIYPEHIEVLP